MAFVVQLTSKRDLITKQYNPKYLIFKFKFINIPCFCRNLIKNPNTLFPQYNGATLLRAEGETGRRNGNHLTCLL